MRAGLYLRVSRDSTGEGLAVDRQEQDCRKLCDDRSWKVVEVYCDNDLSAYSKKRRPDWERLLADVEAGEIDAVVAYHMDRLTRKPIELEGLIDFAERQGLELATCSGDVDLSTATGKMVARIMGATARSESERKAERQKRANMQSAEAGKVSGGGTRAFGYERDGVTVREDEAEIVREVARRLLAGESRYSVAQDLAARDVRTSAGNLWQPTTLRQTMVSARISGRREHLGEIVGTAVWPGIISVEESDRLRRMLTNRAPVGKFAGVPRKYLLSGMLVCGRCGQPLVGQRKDGAERYVCRKVPGTPKCGGISTNAARTDALVREMVLDALDGPGLREALISQRQADPKVLAEIAVLKLRRAEYLDMFDTGELSRAELTERSKPLLARVELLEKRVARVTGPDPLGAFVGSYQQMSDRWVLMNTSQRRAVCDALLEKVEVMPAGAVKGVKGHWDPSRFIVTWKA